MPARPIFRLAPAGLAGLVALLVCLSANASLASAGDALASPGAASQHWGPASGLLAQGDSVSVGESAGWRRGPLRDLGRALRDFVQDGLRIYSSPFRLDARGAFKAGGAISLGIAIFAFDQQIYDGLHRIKDEPFYRPFARLGEFAEPLGLMGRTNIYYFGGLLLGYVLGSESLTRLSAEILESHFVAGFGKNLANYTVGRFRPFEGYGPYHFVPGEGTSFPSGHTITIFQDATIIAHYLPWWPLRFAAYTVATSVAFQRVTSDNHWPSDVYFGALFGTAVSSALLRYHEPKQWSLAPMISAGAPGLALRGSF